LIVSHGSPSDPDPQETFVQGLARSVAALTGAQVVGATLAKKGALEAAIDGLSRPLIFPHFMADGWFVSDNLPKRLAGTGMTHWDIAAPLGLMHDLPGLATVRLQAALAENDIPAGKATVVVAAHGSPSDPRPARATEGFARALRQHGKFRTVRVGYVDEEPSIEDAATVAGPSILLPFFAARAGHVLMDLPEALTAANFKGIALQPIGTWPEIPALIAETLRQPAKACVA